MIASMQCRADSALRRVFRTAALLITLSATACNRDGGYDVVDRAELTLAAAAPMPNDTVPSIRVVGDETVYPCARILPGADATWQGDTLLVTQRELTGRAARARVFCVPYNVPARTEGVESTSRTYPPQPHGDQPGYGGWVKRDTLPV